MVMPGDNVNMECTLIHPDRYGREAALRYPQGGAQIGSGVVTKIA